MMENDGQLKQLPLQQEAPPQRVWQGFSLLTNQMS